MSNDAHNVVRFVSEAREHLAVIGAAMIALEKSPEQRVACIERLLRSTHSLKGGAGFTGCRQIEKLAHAMETVAENIRDGLLPVTPELIDALLFALDRVTVLLDDVSHSEESDISEPLSRLLTLLEGASDHADRAVQRVEPAAPPPPSKAMGAAAEPGEFMLSARVRAAALESDAALYGVKFDWHACEAEFGLSPLEVAERVEEVGIVLDSQLEVAGPPLREGLPIPPFWYRAIISSTLKPEEFARRLAIPTAGIARLERIAGEGAPSVAAAAQSSAAPAAAHAAPASLRVSVSLIDRMMELAGELALVRNQALRNSPRNDAASRRLMRRLDTVTSDLHQAALQLRMQPVATLFDRFPRLVRDLARQLGKQIELEITGAEVELDKTVLEMLADPLTHLVRNCCDHGVESPERRAAGGKAPGGRIRLSARQERGQIVIEVRDDGRGIDTGAVKRKAQEQGLKTSEQLDQMNPRQVYDLILVSGFSTAANVTDVSGRGVGMDVVKTNLERIGGVVEIDSAAGQGTTFLLRLPLTLAIMPCLLIKSGEERYAVPQRDLEEVLLLEPGKGKLRIECSHDEEVLRLRDALLPATRLHEVTGQAEPFDAQTWSRIIEKYHGPQASAKRSYAAVMRAGSRRFALVFDEVLENEEIVVKPLNPLLRPLRIYAGSTILGDGGVALILSAEGIARHSGIVQRGVPQELPALPVPEAAESLGVLLTRHGDQLLAIPLADVRRILMIAGDKIQRVGGRELVQGGGGGGELTLNVLRFETFLKLPASPEAPWYFLVVPRSAGNPIGFLVSEIVDTTTIAMPLDRQAFVLAGVRGSAVVRGKIALVLDVAQFAAMWALGDDSARRALPAAAARRRILLVEDTRFFQTLVGNCLRDAGHEVLVADNGAEGLAQLRGGRFDLVVSDIEMPVMDGLSFAQQVRADGAWRQLPLLALTTLNTPEHRQRALDSGFDAYEIKFERAGFLAAVATLLARTLEAAGERGGRGDQTS